MVKQAISSCCIHLARLLGWLVFLDLLGSNSLYNHTLCEKGKLKTSVHNLETSKQSHKHLCSAENRHSCNIDYSVLFVMHKVSTHTPHQGVRFCGLRVQEPCC